MLIEVDAMRRAALSPPDAVLSFWLEQRNFFRKQISVVCTNFSLQKTGRMYSNAAILGSVDILRYSGT